MKIKFFLVLFICASYFNVFPQGRVEPIKGNTSQLHYFFDALKESRNKKVHVAHYGDSMIEGDVITMDLRDILQRRFGGNGAGFLSMNLDDIKMRKTTNVSFSNDWKEASIFKRNPNKWPFGINAAVFMPSDNSWVKYQVSNYSKTLKSFSDVKVFYMNANDGAQLKYTTSSGENKIVNLEKGYKVKEVDLRIKSAQWIKLEPIRAKGTYFFGASLENGNGVYVDNFPVKGNSGISLSDIPSNVLSEFNGLLNTKLIIINFGLNVLSPEYQNYDWYRNKMEKVVNYFKGAFPKTSILIVSIGDKGVKKGSKFVTDPAVKLLLRSQEEVANKTGVAFWNLYDAMGGENSINAWVNAGPALMFKDYAHLTYEGGSKVGNLLSQALLNEFNKH